MKKPNRLAWMPMAAVTAVLLSILVFLYAKTQSFDESHFFEDIAVLRHLKQLDAQWELDVLKSRIGVNAHYDALADNQGEMARLMEQLQSDTDAHKHEASGQAGKLPILQRAIQDKAALIEQFKSNNSVLRNSLAFLPTAAEDVQQSLGPGRGAAQPEFRQISAGVNRLLLASMLYSQSPTGDKGAEIQDELSRLEGGMQLVPPGVRDRLGIFRAHIQTILREQKTVNELLVGISAAPTGKLLDDAHDALTVEQQQAGAEGERYGRYLLIFSTVLVALLLYAAVDLIGSHSMIQRVNQELQGANETLEQRVRERTMALDASETQLHQITDTVPALIAYIDAEQRFQFYNLAYEERFGLKREQIHGKTMREMMGRELYEKERGKIEEALAGYAAQYDRTQETADGQMHDYVMQYFPRYGEGEDEGKVLGFYSLGTDVTELKRIDRMKSEFVSTVSHELRTPLTSIRGSLGLIVGGVAGDLPPMAKNLVSIATSNCERLIRLINDILDSEKIESGKMRFDMQVIELVPLLAQVLVANEGFAGQHKVKLALDVQAEGVMVSVDSDRLTQALTNLISNAVKFSPAESWVYVRLLCSARRVRVEVADSGPGIPEEFRKRIFQKFSQADTSDTRQKGGTGLGLNISRAIVERMNGSVGFTSQTGVGTVFYFELPEAVAPPVEEAGVAASRIRDGGPVRPLILVCEDDPDIAHLIKLMLDKGGFDSDMVYRAAQAMEQVVKRPYAAMTVDLGLPDLDGISLIRALRHEERTRDLPIVVVSANAEAGELEFNNQPLAVSTWLEKPIDENKLILSLQRAIANMAEGRPRILHVEDDLDIQRIAATIAQDFATFEFAGSLQEAREQLGKHHYDLVLLDLTLKDGSGWELLDTIEALNPAPPIVVFSASDAVATETQRVEAVLVKAYTSNDQLLRTLQRVLDESLWGTVHPPLSV
ncbi:DAHL domain-containing protein [Polaromonas sp. LjRoot131]|uniref:DAHL domain-containing protein n=1 Tax=Polaromonas sp. LjRoot131 TaxID=3342262 RepID=UPI003ECF0670